MPVPCRAAGRLIALQVRIMKDWDPSGKQGPKMPLPDVVTIHQPKVTSLHGKACTLHACLPYVVADAHDAYTGCQLVLAVCLATWLFWQ